LESEEYVQDPQQDDGSDEDRRMRRNQLLAGFMVGPEFVANVVLELCTASPERDDGRTV
jgi:hypothetical protein